MRDRVGDRLWTVDFHGVMIEVDWQEISPDAGAEINAVVQTNSMDLQKQLVHSGRGWTILPAVGIAGDLDGGTLSAAPLCAPEVWRSIVLGVPRTGRVSAAAEIVARELVQRIRLSVRNGRWPSAQFQDGP
jgi:LysR family nitrogen assimilation transcriptional regulator